jgi:hypothetical protein
VTLGAGAVPAQTAAAGIGIDSDLDAADDLRVA